MLLKLNVLVFPTYETVRLRQVSFVMQKPADYLKRPPKYALLFFQFISGMSHDRPYRRRL